MSQWNVDKVRQVYDAFARAEFPHHAFAVDAEWHTDPALPRPMAFYGRDEVAAYFERFIGAWQALGARPVDVFPRPREQVVAIVRMGPPVAGLEPTIAHLWTLRHGVVARVQVFGDRDAALAAAAEVPRARSPERQLADRFWADEREYRGPAPAGLAQFVRGLEPSDQALDVGCGDGRLSVELRARDLTAADISLIALKRARKRLPDATMVLVEAGRRLPFEDETFDLVLCADALNEVQDVAQLVAEVKRVLTPGGTVAVIAPAHGRRTGARVLAGGFDERFDPRLPPLRFFTRRSLGDLLDLAGFHGIEIGRGDGRLLATAQR